MRQSIVRLRGGVPVAAARFPCAPGEAARCEHDAARGWDAQGYLGRGVVAPGDVVAINAGQFGNHFTSSPGVWIGGSLRFAVLVSPRPWGDS